jgi:hypothetical protein
MFSKFSIGLSLLLSLFACSSAKVIKLSPAEGPSKEFGTRSLFTEVVNPDSIQSYFARGLNMDSFVIGKINYYPSSYTVFASRVPVYSNDPLEYQQKHRRLITGTTEDIPFNNLNTEILFLFGRRNDGKYLVIADQNNNKAFMDDSVYTFNKINENLIVSTAGLDSFPQVAVKNAKSYFNKKVYTFTHHLIIEPILSYDLNNQENKNALTLRVISAEFKTGTFKFKGNKYKVAARNALLPYLYYDPRAIKIKFADAADTTAFQKINGRQLTYYIGDTVTLDHHTFKIKKVSPLLNKVTITPLRNIQMRTEE